MSSNQSQNQGLIHIYHGDGKGKTTAAIGLCVRMVGAGGTVAFIQFLKGRNTSELEPLKQLGVQIARTTDVKKFVKSMSPQELELCKQDIQRCFGLFKQAIGSGKFDLVVADEMLHTVNHDFISLEELIHTLEEKYPSTEVVLTGRNPSKDVCNIADYVTLMSMEKHPYTKGITARKGIEY